MGIVVAVNLNVLVEDARIAITGLDGVPAFDAQNAPGRQSLSKSLLPAPFGLLKPWTGVYQLSLPG
jgi:hypothetical protein